MLRGPVIGALERAGVELVEPEPAASRHETLAVSVVIPAYNRAALLQRALDSVARQDVPPAEVIVVDDGSTDSTVEVARRNDVRVVSLPENRGAWAARAHGVRSATQPWIAFLDSDDEWLPWMLSTLWPQREGCAVVAGASVWVRDGRIRSYEGLPVGTAARLTRPDVLVWPQNFIPAAGSLVHRGAMLAAMEHGKRYRYSEDFAAWLRILSEHPALVVARPVVRYHLHAGQKTVSPDRLIDQHAMVGEAVKAGWVPRGQLNRRVRLDAWEQAPGGRARRLARLLHPRSFVSVAGVLAWRQLQRRRLTPRLVAVCSASGDTI